MVVLALLALAQAAVGDPGQATYHGQCFYPPILGDPRPGEVRILCDQVATDETGVEFVDSTWDVRMVRFAGYWEGNILAVRSVTSRTGATVEARGACRIDRANGKVSVIACTAVTHGRSWIGNFRVSKI